MGVRKQSVEQLGTAKKKANNVLIDSHHLRVLQHGLHMAMLEGQQLVDVSVQLLQPPHVQSPEAKQTQGEHPSDSLKQESQPESQPESPVYELQAVKILRTSLMLGRLGSEQLDTLLLRRAVGGCSSLQAAIEQGDICALCSLYLAVTGEVLV